MPRPYDDKIFQARSLTKFYGAHRGIEDFTIKVPRGEIFGLLGPNGAGKTTVIRSALGLLRPTSGETRLFGDPVRTHTDTNHERLGYLPADLRLWPGMSARRLSDLMLRVGGGAPDRKRRDQIAERLELSLDRRIKSLSLGNRQKVGLLLALQHKPELLILDEPTSGLDPLVRRTVYELLHEAAAEGTTIIYSSHNLPEVEQICARVGILRKGQLVALKTIEQLRKEEERRLQFVFAGAPPNAAPQFDFVPADAARSATAPIEALPPELAAFRLVKRDGPSWTVAYHGSPDPLIKWLSQFQIAEINAPQISLEEAFLNYYQGPEAAPTAPRSPA